MEHNNAGGMSHNRQSTAPEPVNPLEVVVAPEAKLVIEYKLGSLSHAAALEQVRKYGTLLGPETGLQIASVKVLQ